MQNSINGFSSLGNRLKSLSKTIMPAQRKAVKWPLGSMFTVHRLNLNLEIKGFNGEIRTAGLSKFHVIV